uniref:Uncharacterized protein n=1 Tax=Anguilla anguilla TaxID=7936 RepID=A0A0E9TLE9_ANGAN
MKHSKNNHNHNVKT